MTDPDALPDEIPALKALIEAQRPEIVALKPLVAKPRRQPFGRRSERAGKLLNPLELQLEELETGTTELAVRLEPTIPPPAESESRAFPPHLPRDVHVHVPDVAVCPDCGGPLKPLGEDVSERLERVPSRFRVIR